MIKRRELENLKRRENIQKHFWNEVGAIEHVSLPRLKDTIRKEFNDDDNRFVQAQIDMMQTEQRIKIESRVKVWIKPPKT